MRNLSTHEEQMISGGSSDELVPISAAVGYAIGDIINQMVTKATESTHFDLAHSIDSCQKTLRNIQSITSIVPVLRSASRSDAASISFHFCCGIYKGCMRRGKPAEHKGS